MTRPFRLAVFDLDGTLLGPEKEISRENQAALQRLRDRGVCVLLASGRPHANVLRFHEQLALMGPIVSGNGSLVKHAETNEVWHQQLLDAALASEILGEGQRRGLTQIWDGPQGVLGWERTPFLEVLEFRTKDRFPVVGDPRQHLAGQSPFKVLWIAEPEHIASLEIELRPTYERHTYMTITDPEYLEFSAPGVNKASGLAVVGERLGISPSETVFFGDGDNDAEALAWAGLGVAMPHARQKALAAADVIGPESAPETAVAQAISAFLGV